MTKKDIFYVKFHDSPTVYIFNFSSKSFYFAVSIIRRSKTGALTWLKNEAEASRLAHHLTEQEEANLTMELLQHGKYA